MKFSQRLVVPGMPKSEQSPSLAKREWKNLIRIIAKQWAIDNKWDICEESDKCIVNIWYYFPTHENRPDPCNVHKPLIDAFKGIIYKDDKYVLVRDKDLWKDKRNPRIEISFRKM